MALPKPIGEQMAAFNASDDTSFTADRSNSILNATCPARIQNTSVGRNASFSESTSTSSTVGKWRPPKREPVKITPLPQIEEVPSRTRRTSATREKRSDYKTRLCDAFRRQGWCPYNNNCTYAHGEVELQVPKRRSPTDHSSRDHRESRDGREHRNSRESREHRERRDSRSRRNEVETSFRSREGGSSTRYHDDNWRQPSSSRQICHAFQRGNCRFGPRCRYLHQEQMPQFNGNATMFAAPTESIAYYHHQNTTQTYMVPYFYAPSHPTHALHQTGGPQYMPCDLNQSIPIYMPAPPLPPPSAMSVAPPAYYPISHTPVMDQSLVMNGTANNNGYVEYSQPPPQLMS